MTKKAMADLARGNTVAGRSVRDLVNRRYRARVRFILPMAGVVLLLSGIAFFISKSLSKLGLIGGFLFLGLAGVMRVVMHTSHVSRIPKM